MKADQFIEKFLESGHTDFIGVNALGILRKDLVAVLGMERAKGFLLRYSRQCGANDAQYLENNFLWDSENDIIHAGYKINDLKGHAKLIPLEVRVDRKKREFYFEGRWYYSYEADQHIQHFGQDVDPVCYTLSGYASGYSSHFFGEEVIFKEIECMGKGDAHCIFIGKPMKEWGDEINDILSHYKEENLSAELDRAYNRIEKQKKMLSDVLDISEKLSKILIKGGDLFDVLKVLSRNLSSTVILEDRNFNLIDACGNYSPYNFMDYVHIQKTNKKPSWMNILFQEKRTIHLTVSKQFRGWKHERLISPVLLNNEVWGYISLIKSEGTFDEKESLLLERANTICALHFSNERTRMETEKRIVGGFLNELLIENSDLKSLSYRMKIMGYDLNKGYYVCILKINDENEQKVNIIDLKNKIIDHIEFYLQSFGIKFLISTMLDKIIILVPKELIEKIRTDPKHFGEQLVNAVSNNFPNIKVNLGISSFFKSIDTFRRSYDEANKSMSLSNRKGHSNVIAFDELGYLGFLLNTNNMMDLEKFALHLLANLLIYDRDNNGELLKTLYFILEYNGNIAQTSRELMISEGAVRYRLKRIGEITDLDLTHSKDFVNAHLGIHILLLFGLWDLN